MISESKLRYLDAREKQAVLKYDLALSPRVWSVSHRQEMKELESLLYQNIYRDGVELLDLAG